MTPTINYAKASCLVILNGYSEWNTKQLRTAHL